MGYLLRLYLNTIGSTIAQKGIRDMKGFASVMDAEGFGTPNERYLFLEMAWRAGTTGMLRLTQQEIAHTTLLSLPTVKRLMAAFQERGVVERLGHGRYKLLVDENFERMIEPPPPPVPGADEELARLQAIRQPHQGIAYTRQGWPVLQDMERLRRSWQEAEVNGTPLG